MKAHKILEFLKTRDALDENGKKYFEYLDFAIKNSEKFVFNTDGLPESFFLDWQNLPYPLVYFEIFWDTENGRVYRVYIAQQDEKDAEISLYVLSSAQQDKRNIHPQNIILKIERLDDDEKIKLSVGRATDKKPILGDFDVEKEAKVMGAEFLQLCQLINCTNVSVKTNPPPKALNKKRIKNGKLPLFEYKTLLIKSKDPKTGQYSIEGDRNSPRLHLRRGHIRRHPTAGNIWVRNCIVGNDKKGVIEKQYRVAS